MRPRAGSPAARAGVDTDRMWAKVAPAVAGPAAERSERRPGRLSEADPDERLGRCNSFPVPYLLLSDSPSGPGAGVILATVSAVFWLFALPVLPIFAMTAILIDALIIYGLLQPDPSS